MWTLIQGAREGNEDALQDFVRRYRAPVIAYCTRRGFRAEAEDLSQEVFLRLFKERLLFKADPSRGRFRSLLIAITRHVIGNHVERATAKKRGGGKVLPLGGIDVASPTDDEEFDRDWVAHLIELALDRLAREHANYHEALQRFLMAGQSYAEIEAETGKSAGELKNHIYRGKQKLIQYLRELVRDYAASRSEYDEELQHLAHFFPN